MNIQPCPIEDGTTLHRYREYITQRFGFDAFDIPEQGLLETNLGCILLVPENDTWKCVAFVPSDFRLNPILDLAAHRAATVRHLGVIE